MLNRASGLTSKGIDLFQSISNPLGSDAIALDALGEIFGLRENLKVTELEDRRKGPGKYEPTFTDKVFGVTPAELKSTRAEKIEKQFETDVDKYGLKLGLADDSRSLKQIADDLTTLKNQEGYLTKKEVSLEEAGFKKGAIVPTSELTSRVQQVLSDRGIRQKQAASDAEWESNYGVPGAPRVTDDGAPVVGSPERGATRQGQRKSRKQIEGDVAAQNAGKLQAAQLEAQGKAMYGNRYGKGKGTAELASEIALEQQVQELENQFNSKGAKYNRYTDQRNFSRDTFIADRAYNRGVFESDRSFNRNTFENDRNFAQRVLENNNALDMRKFELEMQRDMSEDARQQGMIQNLMGGLFSLGSLL